MKAYIADIHSADGKAPQTVRVDVYDPEMNKVGEVTDQTIEPTVVRDRYGNDYLPGNTFTYYFKGPVNLESAGDYHFVVEAQAAADEPDATRENKDAGKWALEQNASASVPPYVVFGGEMPVDNPIYPNGPSYGDMTWAATKASDNLQKAGYVKKVSGKRWWHPNLTGQISPLKAKITANKAIGITRSSGLGTEPWDKLTWSQIHQQTMQYNGVWVHIGHGAGSAGANGGRVAMFFYAGDPNNSSAPDISTGWSYLVDTKTGYSNRLASEDAAGNLAALDELPTAYVGEQVKVRGTTNQYELSSKKYGRNARFKPLGYSNMVVYIGCGTSRDMNGAGLLQTTVALGARTAVGIRGSITGEQGEWFTAEFFHELRNGATLEAAKAEAEDYADFDHVGKGQYAVILYRYPTDKGAMKLKPEWGDPKNLGPEQ